MSNYQIEFTKSASKQLKKLPKEQQIRIQAKIDELADNPRPDGVVKLTNSENYRIRVGSYRIVYDILDDILLISVVKVSHRKDVYRSKN